MNLRVHPRKLLQYDFSLGLAGGVIYYFLYDFMIGTLALPRWLVLTQLLANLSYGLYGAILFTSLKVRLGYFRFLVMMNSIYATFCLGMGSILLFKAVYWGAILLISEGVFIAILAKIERTSLQSYNAVEF